MFVLFLVLCYFILIFNMLVPAIAEKLRVEHDAFAALRQLHRERFVCVNGTLSTFEYTPFGVQALLPVDAKGSPLPCALRDAAESSHLVSCESGAGVGRLRDACAGAYAELFLRI
ncbi:MC125L [Molluscum contagiosum virus subtype 1]|uniref:MC125L n=3 Tax=Molluscum contagiosum virus TaxID=10279 RepID=A0A7G5AXC6_MCV1|nr:MC125L [Molluscum contagiosum virus subtype 1]AZT86326.1 MC125L [Molluscum contagiosum virus]AAC55253.1 MC125L [Molluscum contagiosum virus subtype 1]AQY16874.1 MC125 [Molluscum contagiosum virus subtype 1]AQY17053.1 MC125 [Molluscum contagiosum virus subtype 1]AQY17232.1 MC125 [Molluscum contagiosum virus subtype 1]